MDVVCVGNLFLDILAKPVTSRVFEVDALRAETIQISSGGDACNLACNLSDLGFHSGLVSVVGDDRSGKVIKDILIDKKVNLDGLKTSHRFSTATSIVLTEPGGERHFVSNSDIFAELLPEQISLEILKGAKILSLNGYYSLPNLDDGGVIPVFEMAHELGMMTSLDTVTCKKGNWLDRISSVLHHTDIFLPSYDEASQITGTKNITEMRSMFSNYGIKYFGVKLGSEGSYLTDFSKEYYLKPFPVETVISTVGAGDSFVTGFLAGMLLDMGLYESGIMANAAASLTVQNLQASGTLPKMDHLQDYIQKNRKYMERYSL